MAPSSIKILDGGLGTTLEDEHAVVFDHSKPLWSSDLLVTSPATLLACQTSFVRAGADVLLTDTYQIYAEAFSLTRTDPSFPDGIPSREIPRYLQTALDVAFRAAAAAAAAATSEGDGKDGREVEIALSCGPYGCAMTPGQEYGGQYDYAHRTPEALREWHLERLGWYLDMDDARNRLARLTYVAFETIPRIEEVRGVREAMATLAQGRHGSGTDSSWHPSKFWISCVFPRDGDDDRLPDGSSVEEVVEAMLAPILGFGKETIPWGIGINCTKVHKLAGIIAGMEHAVKGLMARGVVAEGKVPALVLYPDGTNGEVYNTTTKMWEMRQDGGGGLGSLAADRGAWEEQLARVLEEVRDRGVFTEFLVGGCCKAKPSDIRALRERLKG